jgi:hypothetical protein
VAARVTEDDESPVGSILLNGEAGNARGHITIRDGLAVADLYNDEEDIAAERRARDRRRPVA